MSTVVDNVSSLAWPTNFAAPGLYCETGLILQLSNFKAGSPLMTAFSEALPPYLLHRNRKYTDGYG